MIRIDFDDEQTYDDDRIIVDVLIPADAPFVVQMTLDTGANISTFSNSLSEALGIRDLTSGRRGSMMIANGEATVCWIHAVQVEVHREE